MSDQQGYPPPGYAPPPPGSAPPPPGYAPPPPGYAPPPPGYAPPPQAPPKKKSHGCLITLAVVLVLLLIGAGVAFAVVRSMGSPRDLGVTYTEADYWSALKKSGMQVKNATAAEDWANTDARYSGSKPLDAVFSDSEVSALLNYSHMGGWPISRVQVRLTGGSGVELAGAAQIAGTEYPFHATGTAAITGAAVSGSASSAEVFGATIPGQYLEPGSEWLVGVINERLSRVKGLDIKKAEVVAGGLHLVGAVPALVERIKR
jgi:hypothetical protein